MTQSKTPTFPNIKEAPKTPTFHDKLKSSKHRLLNTFGNRDKTTKCRILSSNTKNTEFWSPFKMPECQLLTKKNRYQNAYLLVQIWNAKMPTFHHTNPMSKCLLLAAKIKCRKSQFLTSQTKCQNSRFLTYDRIDEMPKWQNDKMTKWQNANKMS